MDAREWIDTYPRIAEHLVEHLGVISRRVAVAEKEGDNQSLLALTPLLLDTANQLLEVLQKFKR